MLVLGLYCSYSDCITRTQTVLLVLTDLKKFPLLAQYGRNWAAFGEFELEALSSAKLMECEKQLAGFSLSREVKHAAPPLGIIRIGEGGVLCLILVGMLTSIFSFIFFLSRGPLQSFLISVLSGGVAIGVAGLAIAALKREQPTTTAEALPSSE